MRNLFLTIAFVVSLSATSQTTLNLSSGTQTSGFSDQVPVRSVEETSDGYIITYNFATANLMSDDIYTNTYNWEYNNFGVTHETTKPALPIRYEDFVVPEGKYATVSIVGSQYRDFSFELSPAKPACFEGSTLTISDVPEISDYTGFYPNGLVSVVDNQIFRNIDIATVEISPVQYNMRNKIVRAYTELKFKILFEDRAITYSSGPNPDIENHLRLDFRLNTDSPGSGVIDYDSQLTEGAVHKDYLILSVPDFEEQIEKFCEWKRTLGFDMSVIYNRYWTTHGIKAAIDEFASNHPNFTHLLLFGDYSYLPSILCQEWHSENFMQYYSDMSYACLNGANDTKPDVRYGRVPVNNTYNANIFVEKTINYEKNPLNDDSLHNTHTFVALFNHGNPNEPSGSIIYENDRKYTETCEKIRIRLQNKGYNAKYIYQLTPKSSYFPIGWYNQEPLPDYLKYPQYNWNGNANDISSAINEGSSFVLYRGHGSINCWRSEESIFYDISDINLLNNGQKQPIVLSLACSTGNLEYDIPSFSKSFLFKKDGGCAAIISATNPSYTQDNNHLADGLYSTILPKYSSNKNIQELGLMIENGFSNAERFCYKALYQRKIYHCYGDPSLRFFTATPKDITDVTVTRNKNTIRVKCKIPMYISLYNPVKGITSLTYGTSAWTAYAQDLDGNVDGDPQDVIVCVYNTGYKPEIYKGFKKYPLDPILPPIELNSCTISSDQLLQVKYDTLENVGQAQIIVTDVYGNRKIVQDCELNSEESTVDVSSINKGVYVVSLVVDGQLAGSKSVLK